jgi:hypothetical protein
MKIVLLRHGRPQMPEWPLIPPRRMARNDGWCLPVLTFRCLLWGMDDEPVHCPGIAALLA